MLRCLGDFIPITTFIRDISGAFLSVVATLHVFSAVCKVSRRDGHRHAPKHAPKQALLGRQVVAGCKCPAGLKKGLKASGVEFS